MTTVRSHGTDYTANTPLLVIGRLEQLRQSRKRVCITHRYGDDTTTSCGYISRTMGNPAYPNGGIRAPMLVHNRASRGGTILDTENVVEIRSSNIRNGITYYKA